VNSGRKAAMVMITENKIALSTSIAPVKTRRSFVAELAERSNGAPDVCWAIWRKMFSTMITVP